VAVLIIVLAAGIGVADEFVATRKTKTKRFP